MSRRLFAFVTTVSATCLFAHAALAGINYVGAELVNISPKPDYMLEGDFNNDGRKDIVVVSPASKEVNVYLTDNSTPSHFAPGRVVRFGQTLRGAAVGDLNNDERLDVLVTDQAASSVWILLGRGDGTFNTPYQALVETSRNPVAVAVANLDKSGNDDLVVADRRLGRVFILLNNNSPQPQFRRGGELEVGEEPVDVRTVDLDGDTNLDILTLNSGGPRVKEVATVLWTRVVSGFPDFGPVQRFTVGENPGHLVVADFNNDSKPDIAMLNRPASSATATELAVMLGQGGGVLNPPANHPIPCPFFTGGQPCRALALAATDADLNGNVDLMVALTDPRRTRGSASSLADALQAFSGQGDGMFVPGGVLATSKAPAAMVAADLNNDRKEEIVIANDRTLDLQAFINVSTVGGADNGIGCFSGDECLSNRCLNGVCCASACDPDLFEYCAVPGREGTCVPLPPAPQVCGLPEDPECPETQFCIDGFCCDQDCDGRCDTADFPGVCIPGAGLGEDCTADETCKRDLFCSRNFVCCSEPCKDGFCDDNGVCHDREPNGGACEEDEECASNVCDEFDKLCCNRRCNPQTEVCFIGDGVFKGRCVSPDFTPPPDTPTPTVTPTVPPTLSAGADGALCTGDGTQCDSTHCVDGVCCITESCPDGQHCAAGTGVCVQGTALPTITPTPQLQCPAQCPNNCAFQNGQAKCIGSTSSSGGCSVGGDASSGNLLALALFPLLLWGARRFRLERARVRSRAPRQ